MTQRSERMIAAEARELARIQLQRQEPMILNDEGLTFCGVTVEMDATELRRLAALIKARLMEMPGYPDIPFWSVAPGETIATTAPLQRSRVKTAATRVRMQAAREWGRENVVIEHRGGEFFVTRRDRKA